MASLETTGLTEARIPAVPPRGVSFELVARDVAMMGGGTAAAAIFNTLLVFLIPRLLSIEDFGYWRLFLLYTGFLGFLHMGLADGALLRWAGRPLDEIRQEVGPSLKFLFWQHLALIVPGAALVGLFLPRPLNLIGVSLLTYSLISNSETVLQFSLQSARLFRPVAVATSAPVGALVVMTFLWHLQQRPSFRGLIALYCVAWTTVLVYLWTQVGPAWGYDRGDSAWTLGKSCIAMGWPILLANGGFALAQSADRVVVSSALPIQEFAQYSMAASTMFVPVAAIAAVSSVFFPHVAAAQHEGRVRMYEHASKFLVLAWSLLLPYFFVLEDFVRHYLPKYAPALPIAAILFLGVVFLAEIQVLHMSYSYLYGRQREFLFVTVGMLAVSFAVAIAMTVWLRSLVAVAAGQIAVLAVWWLLNDWRLCQTTGQGWKERFRFLSIVGWSGMSYGVVLGSTQSTGWRIPIYYLLVIPALLISCRKEFRLGWRSIHPPTVSL